MRHRVLFILLANLALTSALPAAAAPRWTRIGPDGGTVCALATAPSRPAVVYAGIQTGGVYRSADGGMTWTFAGTGLHAGNSHCLLAVDPFRPLTVWVGSTEGLFKSDTGGATWHHLPGPGGPGQQPVTALAVDPHSSSTVFTAVLGGGLYKSGNGGASWAHLDSAPPFVTILALDPQHPGTLYAGSDGLFKSLDGGSTWAPLNGLPPHTTVSSLTIDPGNSRNLFLSALLTPYRSTDGGATWERIQGLTTARSFAIAPATPFSLVYASAGIQVVVSRDGGTTWSPPLLDSSSSVIALTATPVSIVAGGFAGVFTSASRGASWHAGRGLSAPVVTSLAVSRETPPRLYAETSYQGGVFKTRNDGAFWQPAGPLVTPGAFFEGSPVAVSPSLPQTVYLATQEGFFGSADRGDHWTRSPWNSCVGPLDLVVNPSDPGTLVLSGYFTSAVCERAENACLLFRSIDRGLSWECIGHGLPSQVGPPFVLGFNPFQAQELYVPEREGLYRSPDGGHAWSLLAPGIVPVALAFSPVQEGLVYAALPHSVGRSTDGGATWEIHRNGLPPGEWLAYAAIDPAVPSTVYVATATRVFRSTDSGVTWALVGAPFTDVTITGLAVDPVDPALLYVSTRGGGVMSFQQGLNP